MILFVRVESGSLKRGGGGTGQTKRKGRKWIWLTGRATIAEAH